jgi:hypothetical protein
MFKNIYSPILLLVLIFTSCEAELEKAPLDQFSSETFWQDENDALLALTGVYRGTMTLNTSVNMNDWWSYTGLMWLDLATDDGFDRRGVNSPVHKLTNGTNTASNGFVSSAWETSYKKIARSNDFLNNIQEVPMEENKIARFSSEVRAIRAWQYFNLAQYFGDVPLVKEAITIEEANSMPRMPKQQVMQFVIDELKASVDALPTHAELPGEERGRLTRQAVLSFLGRALLAEKDYPEAAVVYEDIIGFGENFIDPDYESLFWEEGENSDEIIFSTQYVADEGANAMYQHTFPAVLGGWHFINPLADLVMAYEFDDGTPFSYTDPRYDPANEAANRDPRLGYTVLFNGESLRDTGHRYITHPDSSSSPDQLGAGKQATQSGYGIQKRMDFNYSGGLRNSGANIAVVRYAEILLSYLEAKLEAGDAIDQALLDATINKVRGRASVDMPPVTVTDPTQLRKVLRNERRIELAFEGIHYWDLLRWETAETELNADFYGAPFPNATRMQKKDGQTDPYNRWYVMSRNFRPQVDYLWPIPQTEVNINPNLEQNPGY